MCGSVCVGWGVSRGSGTWMRCGVGLVPQVRGCWGKGGEVDGGGASTTRRWRELGRDRGIEGGYLAGGRPRMTVVWASLPRPAPPPPPPPSHSLNLLFAHVLCRCGVVRCVCAWCRAWMCCKSCATSTCSWPGTTTTSTSSCLWRRRLSRAPRPSTPSPFGVCRLHVVRGRVGQDKEPLSFTPSPTPTPPPHPNPLPPRAHGC